MLARTNLDDSERPGNDQIRGFARRFDDEAARARKVLLVDDHNLFRELLAVILYRLTDLRLDDVQARSIAEARRILNARNSNDFALAILDVDMPDQGGLELIRELRQSGIQVLALTAHRDSEQLAWASKSGPDKVLNTSASFNELLDLVRELVGT